MQNMRIFLEDAVKYFPSEISKLGISEANTDNIYQKVMNKVGGEDKFLDFLMGFLNLLYENFDMYFFKGFTEPSLLHHMSVKGEELRKLIQDFYAGKIEIGPKDYYLSKLKSYDKESILQVFKLFVELGKLAPDVYKRYGKEDVLDKREREIKERYPNIREVKEKRVVTQKPSETPQEKQYEQREIIRERYPNIREVEEKRVVTQKPSKILQEKQYEQREIIRERYPNIREVEEERVVTQKPSETLQEKQYKQRSFAKLKLFVLAIALIALIILLYIIIRLLGN